MKADSVMGSVFSFKISTFIIKFAIMSMENINFLVTGGFQRQQASRIAACFNTPATNNQIQKSDEDQMNEDTDKDEDKEEANTPTVDNQPEEKEEKQSMSISEHQAMQKARIASCFNMEKKNDLQKGGEGSRGGKVIGHTQSGKPIYNKPDHPSHANFTAKDHEDAVDTHSTLKFKTKDDVRKKMEHHKSADEHHRLAQDANGEKRKLEPIKNHREYVHGKHELQVNSSYGDAVFSDHKLALAHHHSVLEYQKNNSDKKETAMGGSSIVKTNDGKHIVTNNKRASIFEKQGTGKRVTGV